MTVTSSVDYSALFSSTSGLSSDLLTSWYNLRTTQSAAVNPNSATAQASALTNAQAQSANQVTPPWDASVAQSTSAILTSALSGRPLVDESAVKLADPNASDSDQKLFALYTGLSKLSAIANNAADKSTASILMNGLNKQFQKGLSEILSYAQSIKTSDLAVTPGQKASRVSAGIVVPNGALSQYTTKIIQRTLPTNPIPGLNGTEQFTVSVTKGGVTQNINIDLSTLGTSQPTLDDVIGLVNGQLAAAGDKTKLHRIRLDTKKPDGTDISPPPQTWGIQVMGVSTEKIAFSAPSGGTAVYLAGNSGTPNDLAGQMLKLDASGATPSVLTTARIEAQDSSSSSSSTTPIPTPSSSSNTTKVTSDSKDAGVQSAISNINSILAKSATTSTSAQQATSPPTNAAASAIDSQGNTYIVGTTAGSINGDVVQGTQDAYLTKYDSTGAVVWQRMLGDTGSTQGAAVAVDGNGNVVIAGKTNGNLTGGTTGNGGYNSFVTKYDSTGAEIFTRNVGPVADDSATAVAVGSDGSIYFGGQTKSALAAGSTYGGGQDAFVTKLTSTGKLVYNRQFGGTGDQNVTGLSTDASGNLVVLSMDQGNAKVTSFDSTNGTSAALWSQDLGDLSGGQASAITVDGSNIYVGGWTNNANIGGSSGQNTFNGGTDGFVVQLDDTGAVNATRFVGTSSTDRIRAITVKSGDVYVAGDTTGDISGVTNNTGKVNGFAGKVDMTNGSLVWSYQYSGRNGQAQTYGIQVDNTGSSVLDVLGLPKGTISYNQPLTITSQSTVRPGQEFFVAVNGGPQRAVFIDASDTLNDLAIKLNTLFLQNGTASVSYVPGGASLTIKSKGTGRIDLSSGPPGNDALKGLGLSPSTIVADPPATTTNKNKVTDNYKSPFSTTNQTSDPAKQPLYVGLNLANNLDISTKDGAASATQIIQAAMSNLRTAFRTLNPDPTLQALQNTNGQFSSSGNGSVPDYLSAQLANYQSALQRLTAGTQSASTTTALI
ncbi:MAG: SBBP repeat-containing protein [Alphaproteobacteria bacterium]